MEHLLPPNFKHMIAKEKRQFLAANCDETRNDETVTRMIKGEQKDSYKQEFVEESLKVSMIEDEKKKVLDVFKERLAPHKKKVKDLTGVLKTGAEMITSDVFLFRDHENGRVYSVLPDGEVIDDRRMLDHERQSTINSSMRPIQNR